MRHRFAARTAGAVGELPGGADGDPGVAGHRRHPQMQSHPAALVAMITSETGSDGGFALTGGWGAEEQGRADGGHDYWQDERLAGKR